MAKLIYAAITSLDGYTEDDEGNFDWSAPDEEVHAFVNDLERPIGTYLYGRRMYDVMSVWETMGDDPDEHPVAVDFASIWRAADKVVYSRTLTQASTPRTRIEPDFDPDTVAELKATAEADITVGGAELAGQAIAAGLVDEIHQFLSPVVVGGGKHFLPAHVRLQLDLTDLHRFGNGVVHLQYLVS
jgi:dihydrofolate reductase